MMKKLLLAFALALFAGQIIASPVDVITAKSLGVKFLKTNVLSARSITDVELAYTLKSVNDTPYLYIFNYSDGFVIVAADDCAYPILAVSDEGALNADDIPEGLAYYLNHYGEQIQFAVDNGLVADEEVSKQWELLRNEGVTKKDRLDRAVAPLLTSTWNQDYPYNLYAPACQNNGYNGGHCYSGCVATSMATVMHFWKYPEHGVGSYSYVHPTYGTLSADFENATYDWNNMPNSVSTNNAAAQAISLIQYHCGVSVDMDFAYDGSGAQTSDVVDAAIEHFRYGACTNIKSRDSYTKSDWEDLLIANFDKGFPMVYAGVSGTGSNAMGHAFNCDGYNDARQFHFNWGWSGSGNGYFEIDALNIPSYLGGYHFNNYQRAIFDMIPDYLYDKMVPQITSFQTYVADAMTKTCTLSWTVPSESVSGAALTSIQKIVIRRNNEVIMTFDNPTIGEDMSFNDEVQQYGSYLYSISAYNEDVECERFSQAAIFGPNCTWKLVCTTTNFQGWNGGKIQMIGENGAVFREVTMTNSTPLSEKFQIAEGAFSMKWCPVNENVTLSISLKNSANQQVYNFSGNSSQLSGTIYSGTNDCDGCTPPTNLVGEYVYQNGEDGALLSWDCDYEPSNFKVYRSEDGDEFVEIAKIDNTSHEYFDAVGNGTYYYKVTAYSSACESTPASVPDGQADFVVVEVLAVSENSIDAHIYPNPTDGMVNILAQEMSLVRVFNTVGQKILEVKAEDNRCTIDFKNFNNGIYLVEIQSSKGVSVQKVTVK